MSFSGGHWGKLLRVNLTTKEIKVEKIADDVLKNFVGGNALGAKILYDEVPAHADPLGPDNRLIISTGPLVGTRIPCTSRMCVTTKSPQTGCVASSFSGGYFPVEFKWAGYDVLVIEGVSDKPVMLVIHDEKVSLRDAEKYWGLNALDVQTYIKEDLDDWNYRIATIGPAGENKSSMACIINEARAAGRKGVGAVMGSKKLKAIAVRGTQKDVPVADKKMLQGTIIEQLGHLKKSPIAYPIFSKTGSAMATDATTELGVFPVMNYLEAGDAQWGEILGSKAFADNIVTKNPCYNCPMACSQVRLVKKGHYAGIASEGPEYESVYSLGSVVGIKETSAIIAADRLCDELGLDSISAGVTAAFAMELNEKGLFTDMDGLEMRFGNDLAFMEFLRKIAYKEGTIGRIFSDGTKAAADKIGNNTKDYAMQVKGLELPAYDVRGLKAHGLNYATSYTGADHCRGFAFQEVFGIPVPHAVERLSLEGKGKLAKFNQDFCGGAIDIPIFCHFTVLLGWPEVAHELAGKFLTAVTGWGYSAEDVCVLGERLTNLTRMFNVREGFSRKDDSLPKRLREEPLKKGLSKGEVLSQRDLDTMLNEYYEVRGWTEDGIPTPQKLNELGLQFTLKDLPGS